MERFSHKEKNISIKVLLFFFSDKVMTPSRFSLIVFLSSSVSALEKVKISVQPAFHGIPIWAAKENGWFEELGLDVELSVFASGAPQVKAAVESEAWDFGIAGSVPNVIAGQQGILTVGINNDESATTEVVAEPGVTEWPPTELTPEIFAATPKSTGELLLRQCLVAAGLDFNDDHVYLDQQKPLMEKLVEEGDPRYACLWAPNTYKYREAQPRAKVVCSGRTVNFPIYGGLMMREEWALNNKETAKKVLAAYLRGVTFMQNLAVREEVLKLSDEYHKFTGNTLQELALEEDLILRPLFNLDAQLVHLDRNFANDYTSDADKHYILLEEFLFQQEVIDNKHEPKEYVTDEYMKLVSEDAELRAFSYFSAADFAAKGISTKVASESGPNVSLIVGIVVAVVGVAAFVIAFFIMK